MPTNIVRVEFDASDETQASAKLRNFRIEIESFDRQTKAVAQSGTSLKQIFAGNVLADYFQRGTRAAAAFTAETIRAAAQASDANRQLEFSATQAGLSYTRSAELAEDFGRRVGASNTQAAGTLSDLIRLAERAGSARDIDLIQRRFADLAAARGLRGQQLGNVIQTILSGQDEGLNRLGIDDPGKLNIAYAAQIGKNAEALTLQEKARAALNAVLEKGADAEGQAAARLESTAGKLNTATASYENLKTSIGEAVTNSIEFQDALQFINNLLGDMVTSHAKARRELALGLKTPEQIAQEERDSGGRQTLNFLKGALTYPSAEFRTQLDVTAYQRRAISLEELETRIRGNAEAVYNPGQRQYEARVAQLRQTQRELQQQEQEASAKQAQIVAKSQLDAANQAARTNFTNTASAVFKEENLTARVEQLRALKVELGTLSGAFDAEEVKKQATKIDEEIKKTSEQITQSVLSARDAVRSFLTDAAQAADKDNPLVSLFVRAQTEVEETRKRFLIFGADFADEMARIKKEAIDGEIALARFTSGFSALKLLQEARRLSQPFIGLTGPQERRRDVISAQLSDLTEGEEYRRRALALENPAQARNAQRELNDTFRRLQALDISGAGRAGKEAQADAILNLLKDVDPRTLTGTARGALIDANRTKAAGFEENVRDAIARERAGNLIQQDARELLKAINASGLTDAAKLKEFLSVTGSLSDKELVGDLRLASVNARRASAQFENERDRNAELRARKLEVILDRFDKTLTDRGIKVDAGPAAQINISSRDVQATAATLGPAMLPGS